MSRNKKIYTLGTVSIHGPFESVPIPTISNLWPSNIAWYFAKFHFSSSIAINGRNLETFQAVLQTIASKSICLHLYIAVYCNCCSRCLRTLLQEHKSLWKHSQIRLYVFKFPLAKMTWPTREKVARPHTVAVLTIKGGWRTSWSAVVIAILWCPTSIGKLVTVAIAAANTHPFNGHPLFGFQGVGSFLLQSVFILQQAHHLLHLFTNIDALVFAITVYVLELL